MISQSEISQVELPNTVRCPILSILHSNSGYINLVLSDNSLVNISAQGIS